MNKMDICMCKITNVSTVKIMENLVKEKNISIFQKIETLKGVGCLIFYNIDESATVSFYNTLSDYELFKKTYTELSLEDMIDHISNYNQPKKKFTITLSESDVINLWNLFYRHIGGNGRIRNSVDVIFDQLEKIMPKCSTIKSSDYVSYLPKNGKTIYFNDNKDDVVLQGMDLNSRNIPNITEINTHDGY